MPARLVRPSLRSREVLTWIARYESGAPLLPRAAYTWYGPGD
jgi:hypothetical protein